MVTGSAVQAANTNFICTVVGLFTCTSAGVVVPQFRSEVNGSAVIFAASSFALIREF